MPQRLKWSDIFASGQWRVYASVVVLSSLLVMVFYSTPLRDQMENLLFDLRIVLKPAGPKINQIIVVGIPDYADKDSPIDSEALSKIAFADAGAALQGAINTQAALISVLLFPSIFDYESPEAGLFSVDAATDPRVLIGTMGLDTEYPSVRKMPNQFSLISDRLFGLETFRARRHQTIRRMPYNGYRGMTPIMLMPLAIAARQRGEVFKSALLRQLTAVNWQVEWFPLNYVHTSTIPSIDLDDFLRLTTPDRQKLLADKIVLIAPLFYRERPINSDQVFANTPWQREGDEPVFGKSLSWIQANAIHNLLSDSYLREPPHKQFWVITQTIVMAFWCGIVWQWGIVVAVIGLICGWGLLLFAHAWGMSQWAVFLPMSDTALFSAVATMFGCLWRIQLESMMRAKERAKSDARRETARLQSRFLDDFAMELLNTNQQVMDEAVGLKGLVQQTDRDLLNRFVISSQEFDEYLRSIRDFAGLSAEQARQVRKDRIHLHVLIHRVARHFELKCQAELINLEFDLPEHLEVRSDERMLEAIIFNFMSNAIKYSPRGGTVQIKAFRVRRRYVRVEVVDQGPGIAEEFQERIFEKFYRVRDDRNVAIKGNGLGLYLCKYFSELLGGSIELVSGNGKGSTFSIELRI